jgi:hypothetical protein
MTRDTTLSQSVIAGLALTLMFGVPLTSVRADAVQPLPRATTTSAGDDVRWLERLPPATQPLPRLIDVAQSDTGSLQEALKRLESRVESGAFDSAPSAVEADETSAREPAEPVEAGEETGISVSVPQPPVTPVPPVAPVPPVIPVAPESAPADAADATPERTLDSRSPTFEKPAASPSPAPETPVEDPAAALERPATAPEIPSPASSRNEPTEETTPAPLETKPETTFESIDERIADTPEPAVPAASTERWQVQLLAGRSLSRVERDRDDILRFHGDRVAGLTLAISRASPNGFYRLRALDWASQAEAGVWCRQLRVATGLQCVVVRGDALPDSAPPSPAR